MPRAPQALMLAARTQSLAMATDCFYAAQTGNTEDERHTITIHVIDCSVRQGNPCRCTWQGEEVMTRRKLVMGQRS